ncbi:MAG: hypothetical protein NVS9B15_24270 [Acidobacteriaceae bacterium]
MLHSRASIVASGTATVEAALVGNPFVVVYRVSPITYALGKRLVTVNNYAMPNLIAGREIVPEFIQDGFTAAQVAIRFETLVSDSIERRRMLEDLAAVKIRLRRADSILETAIARTASAVRELADQVAERTRAHG